MSLDVRQWFKDVVCEHEEAYQFDVENLVKDNSLGNWMILDHLSYLCYTIAIKKLILENDVIGYKQQLYKAGRYFELYVLAEPLNVPSHPRYVKGENCFKGTANYYGDLYSALISQNPELIVSLAHLLGWRGEEEDFKINDLNPENGQTTKRGLIWKHSPVFDCIDIKKWIWSKEWLSWRESWTRIRKRFMMV
ncbi:hypothetical protein [Thermoactinomyces sp. CICC 10522]|uniref:hypothetical protein n=1 Tax=Thermoactinomyces sp. CICC 10522 TaxID=2767427 RepID=UPI0018DB2AA6|nr:hypothetical protein [Thermoactinomyces sp. CICC 10522]MBH8605717.1 hypothetical protein [Thermoactinomyces sp. CICC 10522]